MSLVAQRIRLFEQARAVPYGTDGAHRGSELLTARCGDCLAKSDYLRTEFAALGLAVRRVRWLYHLPDSPAEVMLLPSREDVHSAVEVNIDGTWVLVDATHDPALARAGFIVADWDGVTSTVPAYHCAGAIWREGDSDSEPVPNAHHDEPYNPAVGKRYRDAFNQWLREVRAISEP
ncbi:hypothetical protein ACFVV7_37065 [Streptomyces globisporus]|uniref:hypothetical protein n=1 Tax=Streptomyces globisporus TaxID=1908 RepID=UPI0036DF2E6B